MANGHDSYDVLREYLQKTEAADEARTRLEASTHFATVAFFDLVGSTAYRWDHGPIDGLAKSKEHNEIVSRAVLAHNGYIVKWLGDGVFTRFSPMDNESAHQVRALRASLDALEWLDEYNARIDEQHWYQRIDTRISISTGEVHLWTAMVPTETDGDPEERIITHLDPMAGQSHVRRLESQ